MAKHIIECKKTYRAEDGAMIEIAYDPEAMAKELLLCGLDMELFRPGYSIQIMPDGHIAQIWIWPFQGFRPVTEEVIGS